LKLIVLLSDLHVIAKIDNEPEIMPIPEGNVNMYMSVLTKGCTRLALFDSQSVTIEQNTKRSVFEIDCNNNNKNSEKYEPGVVLKMCPSPCTPASPVTRVL
jgi:hypothetical protein